jgi:uncharacterized membrane protein YqjE
MERLGGVLGWLPLVASVALGIVLLVFTKHHALGAAVLVCALVGYGIAALLVLWRLRQSRR